MILGHLLLASVLKANAASTAAKPLTYPGDDHRQSTALGGTQRPDVDMAQTISCQYRT